MFEVDGEDAADGERGDRDKRKIGIKLGVTNGIINFVFGVSSHLSTQSDELSRSTSSLSYIRHIDTTLTNCS